MGVYTNRQLRVATFDKGRVAGYFSRGARPFNAGFRLMYDPAIAMKLGISKKIAEAKGAL